MQLQFRGMCTSHSNNTLPGRSTYVELSDKSQMWSRAESRVIPRKIGKQDRCGTGRKSCNEPDDPLHWVCLHTFCGQLVHELAACSLPFAHCSGQDCCLLLVQRKWWHQARVLGRPTPASPARLSNGRRTLSEAVRNPPIPYERGLGV